jgi:formate hydrogenlyase transcriptional activator
MDLVVVPPNPLSLFMTHTAEPESVSTTLNMTASERLEALLRAGRSLTPTAKRQIDPSALVRELHRMVDFDYLYMGNCAEDSSVRKSMMEVRGDLRLSAQFPFPLQESSIAWVHRERQPLSISNWEEERRFPQMKAFLQDLEVASTCTLPLFRPDRLLGVIEFGSSRPSAYSPEEVRFLSLAADQIALALDAAVNFMSAEVAESRLDLLLELTNSVVSRLEFRDLLQAISSSVRRVLDCYGVGVMLPDETRENLQVFALDIAEASALKNDRNWIPMESSPGKVFQTRAAVMGDPADLPGSENDEERETAIRAEIKSVCLLPLLGRKHTLGVLALGKREQNGFRNDDLPFLSQVANQVSIAVENALAYGEIESLKDKLVQEKLYLEEEIRGDNDFDGIVGQSSALRHVLKMVDTVAPSDSTVLLLGETGTGKELIARAIHDRSRRKGRTLVRLNCAAIPTGLLESELFGHEKGAFTGAIAQKIGRLELADQGTLFLDEVGDIPFEIQPKLLRALQEREFERLGSTRTKKVDVRLVAATNRDLGKMIADREFRADLYYRLNVFPIRIPPLRERPEDIPLLVRYFTQTYSRRMNKQIDTISAPAMKKLTSWRWPGNIRELENVIERSVIVTTGLSLQVTLDEQSDGKFASQTESTRDSTERDQIVRILKESNGRVSGAGGAAERMGIPRTTLISRMNKLGIDPKRIS